MEKCGNIGISKGLDFTKIVYHPGFDKQGFEPETHGAPHIINTYGPTGNLLNSEMSLYGICECCFQTEMKMWQGP